MDSLECAFPFFGWLAAHRSWLQRPITFVSPWIGTSFVWHLPFAKLHIQLFSFYKQLATLLLCAWILITNYLVSTFFPNIQ
jgi:hypothetical protein